jgi:hypothetical protein
MAKKTFEELKPKIQEAIENKLKQSPIQGEEGFILIDGFFMQTLQKETSGSFVIGGPSVPSVAVVGKTTGRIYFFALKVLLPNIEL